LEEVAEHAGDPHAASAKPEPTSEAESSTEPEPLVRPFRPIRPRRPAPASNQALQLWLVFGVLCTLIVLFVAIQANVERARQPVEGSSEDQQKRADEIQAALEKDSTDVRAHVALGDILYDTGNWSQAIVHYRAALRRDSTLTSTIVDLGVCYYNLGHSGEAEEFFQEALRHDPHHPVALFNLGILAERKQEWQPALQYYHRALESQPPEAMRQPLVDAMTRVQQKTGRTAPPLPDGR
jgi:tetratricopeptide (TPR) repeat protein